MGGCIVAEPCNSRHASLADVHGTSELRGSSSDGIACCASSASAVLLCVIRRDIQGLDYACTSGGQGFTPRLAQLPSSARVYCGRGEVPGMVPTLTPFHPTLTSRLPPTMCLRLPRSCRWSTCTGHSTTTDR